MWLYIIGCSIAWIEKYQLWIFACYSRLSRCCREKQCCMVDMWLHSRALKLLNSFNHVGFMKLHQSHAFGFQAAIYIERAKDAHWDLHHWHQWLPTIQHNSISTVFLLQTSLILVYFSIVRHVCNCVHFNWIIFNFFLLSFTFILIEFHIKDMSLRRQNLFSNDSIFCAFWFGFPHLES